MPTSVSKIYGEDTMDSKLCKKCLTVKPVSEFNKKTSAADGLQTYCRSCSSIHNAAYKKANRKKCTARENNRRAKKLAQVPAHACLTTIAEIYKHCPKGYHVDHIIALNSGGFHDQYNLCYLPSELNIIKSDNSIHDIDPNIMKSALKPIFDDNLNLIKITPIHEQL